MCTLLLALELLIIDGGPVFESLRQGFAALENTSVTRNADIASSFKENWRTLWAPGSHASVNLHLLCFLRLTCSMTSDKSQRASQPRISATKYPVASITIRSAEVHTKWHMHHKTHMSQAHISIAHFACAQSMIALDIACIDHSSCLIER